MCEQTSFFYPDGQYGCAGITVPVFPLMGTSGGIALVLIGGFKQPLSGLAELDALPFQPLVQHPGSHSQFFGYLRGRIGTFGLQHLIDKLL